jgi:hypothetical protein
MKINKMPLLKIAAVMLYLLFFLLMQELLVWYRFLPVSFFLKACLTKKRSPELIGTR